MRILMIAYFAEASGYGQASRDYAMAMDSVGLDIVIRTIRLGSSNFELPERLLELENKDSSGCDVCIQHLLPHHMEFNGLFKKNIGLFVCETSNFKSSTWADQLNLMDEVIVPCMANKRSAEESGVTVPIHVIPHATDITRFERSYQPLEQLKPYRDQEAFIFYVVGEWVRRKNMGALIRAFHTEFDPDENVELVIKSNVPGLSPADAKAFIESACNEIKDALKLHGGNRAAYKPEIVITERLTQEGIMRLHEACDCFVSTSHGEGWCAVPGTLIDTVNGPCKIENVSVGDKVFTHNGRERDVTCTLHREYAGKIVQIKVHGFSEAISFTSEHQHFICKRNKAKYFKDVVITPNFVAACNVSKGDFWVVPKLKSYDVDTPTIKISDFIDVVPDSDGMITCHGSYPPNECETLKSIASRFGCSFQFVSKVLSGVASKSNLAKRILQYVDEHGIRSREPRRIPNTIQLTPEFMFFVGHYIAEGCTDKDGHISLATHHHEFWGRAKSTRGIISAFGIIASGHSRGDKAVSFGINNTIIAKFMNALCGNLAENKFIHPSLKRSSNLPSLIQGYVYGDGSSTDGRIRMSTVSVRLARDIIEFGNRNSIFITNQISMRENAQDCSELSVIAQHNERFFKLVSPMKYSEELQCSEFCGQQFLIEDENAFYLPIQKIETYEYQGLVFNLSVDEDESYTTNGYATHNCIPAFDAMAMGKTPIVPDCSPFTDFVFPEGPQGCFEGKPPGGWLVSAYNAQVHGVTDTFGDLCTGREEWKDVKQSHLRMAMRQAFTDSQWRDARSEAGRDRAYDFTHEQVGLQFQKVLHEQQETRPCNATVETEHFN